LILALERALSKEKEHRFPTMEDFASAVSGERSGTATVISSPVSLVENKQSRKTRPMLLALSVSMLALAGAAWLGSRRVTPVEPMGPSTPAPIIVQAPPPEPAPAIEAPVESRPKPRPAKKEYAVLTITSEPWGTLYIDDVEMGPTPMEDYRLGSGTYHLRIEQEGYRTKKETLVLNGPGLVHRHYTLEPQ
jgi:hypothetical protein